MSNQQHNIYLRFAIRIPLEQLVLLFVILPSSLGFTLSTTQTQTCTTQQIKKGYGITTFTKTMRLLETLPKPTIYKRNSNCLQSSFYSDFEDFENNDDEDEDEEEDDDEYIDLDEKAFANFRAKMGGGDGVSGLSESNSLFDNEDDDEEDEDEEDYDVSSSTTDREIGSQSFSTVDDLISFATSSSEISGGVSSSSSTQPPTDWATPIESLDFANMLKGGVVLLANPAKFTDDIHDIDDESKSTKLPSSALLAKFGLTIPPPAEIGADRRADLLPVLIMLERHPLRGSQALLLNRRTGYLIGDLEQNQYENDDGSITTLPPQLGAFMIQPLWFGGTSSGGEQSASASSKGLEMLHMCPIVDGAIQLTDDGLYWGGDPTQAQDVMNDPRLDRVLTGFDFKFFVQSTRWLPLQLEKEIRDGTWIMASVSKDVLFKSRDRLGVKRAKPLWTEVMELMGGKYSDIRDQLYGDES